MSVPTTPIDAAGLAELLGSGRSPRILDVRTPGEFESAHIPGSVNIPLDLLRSHRGELCRLLDDDVVLVCRTGRRAVQAQQALAAAGRPDPRVLDGGIVAWQAAGAPVREGRPRWDLERQVRLVVGSVVVLALLASIVVPAARWIALFVGAGLVFGALVDTCALGMLLARLPYNRGPRCDVTTALGQLGTAAPGR